MNERPADDAAARGPDGADEPGGRAPAPPPLRLVQLFLNTADIEGGTDELGTVEGLRSWLAGHGLLPAGARVSRADRDRVVGVREALRDVVGANGGQALPEPSLRLLNGVRGAVLRVEFEADGAVRPRAAATGVDGAIAALLAVVVRASADGSWSRLKVCRRDACRWVFYDHSKNRSGTWCTMAICGSRTKARTYYRRQAGAPVRPARIRPARIRPARNGTP